MYVRVRRTDKIDVFGSVLFLSLSLPSHVVQTTSIMRGGRMRALWFPPPFEPGGPVKSSLGRPLLTIGGS